MIRRISLQLFLTSIFLTLLFSSAYAESDLGSPARYKNEVSDDYAAFAGKVMPPYKTEELSNRLESIRDKYPKGDDSIKAHSLEGIEKLLGLPAKKHTSDKTTYEAPGLFYKVDKPAGVLYFRREVKGIGSLSDKEGKEAKPIIQSEHMNLLKELGIDNAQIIYSKTSLILSQSFPNPKYLPNEQPTEPSVYGIMTYALRQIDGILIEGSEAKLISKKPGTLAVMNVKWPNFRFHPELKSYKLKEKDVLAENINQYAKKIAKGNKMNIRIAVVLRPVTFNKEIYFLPALRVGLKGPRGFTTIFYEDLNSESVRYEKEKTILPGFRSP